MLKFHVGLFMVFVVTLAAPPDDCTCVFSIHTNEPSDNLLIDDLRNKIVDLQIKLTENNYKDEVLNSLKYSLKVANANCNKTDFNYVLSLNAKINELEKLVKQYETQLADSHLMLPNQSKLEDCLARVFMLEKTLNSYVQSPGTGHLQNGFMATGCGSFNQFSGPRQIYLPGVSPIFVMCDSRTAGPGWIVMQRRLDGSVDFYKGWLDYRKGFGDPQKEYFIGLENLYHITNYKPCELHIHLEKFTGQITFVRYNNFRIGNEASKYELLSLGIMTTDGKDVMRHQEHMKFTTYDKDNDNWSFGNLAEKYHGGWWYADYVGPNLSGRYLFGHVKDMEGLHWHDLTNHKTVIMLIRHTQMGN